MSALNDDTVSHFPFRASGKLFYRIGTDTYVCSASLIKKGVLVTAAHCVAKFGQRRFYSNWEYVPAFDNGTMPFGKWTGATAIIMTSYFDGTDACSVRGIVCPNDVAVITLHPQAGVYPGTRTGWFNYAFNGWGFSPWQAQITQLGYSGAPGSPIALDNGLLEQRTDSQGFVSTRDSSNTIIGSLQTEGSSGGPWILNLGVAPSLRGTPFGTAPIHNIVVGVTSWVFLAVKQQGASPFTSGNITVLVRAACLDLAAC